jgi:hypothetical protein
VRSATDIGSHSISVAAAAVRLACQLFADLGDRRVLFIGAGEMIELAATHFAARKPAGLAVANRTLQHAEALAGRFGAQAMRLADVPRRLADFDVVVSCTGSQRPVLRSRCRATGDGRARSTDAPGRPGRAARHRGGGGERCRGVHLYTLDDLAQVVREGLASRSAAVEQAEDIIGAAVAGFEQWLAQRGTVPLIRQLHARAEEWRTLELARAREAAAGPQRGHRLGARRVVARADEQGAARRDGGAEDRRMPTPAGGSSRRCSSSSCARVKAGPDLDADPGNSPAPWFVARTASKPRFHMHTLGGASWCCASSGPRPRPAVPACCGNCAATSP